MKHILILALLAVSLHFYLQKFPSSTPATVQTPAQDAHGTGSVAQNVIIAPAPSSYDRWQTGPNAQNQWKTGPNAQTDFAPFAPSEHANWNRSNGGYTIVSGGRFRP